MADERVRGRLPPPSSRVSEDAQPRERLACAAAMADVQPLRALHYDLAKAGPLGDVAAPPYDVIDADQRAALLARSPNNVVEIDLPSGEDPYAQRPSCSRPGSARASWCATASQRCGRSSSATAVPTASPGRAAASSPGSASRTTGRADPPARAHPPGTAEDRLRLTRATRANLSPIFSLYSDPGATAWNALAAARPHDPWGEFDRRRRDAAPPLARAATRLRSRRSPRRSPTPSC